MLNSQAILLLVTKVNLPVHEDKNKIPYVKVCIQVYGGVYASPLLPSPRV